MVVLFWALALLAEVDMPRARTRSTEYAEPAPTQTRTTSGLAVSALHEAIVAGKGW